MSIDSIKVSANYTLSTFQHGDEGFLLGYLNDASITQYLQDIPNPYTLKMAREWVQENIEFPEKFGHHLNLVIRNKQNELIGGIGKKIYYHPKYPHATEIGYWLAPHFWGKGIATSCVKAYTKHLINKELFGQIVAICFEENLASARVLEKSGYKLKGILNKFAPKHSEYNNALLYVYIK